MKRFGIERLRDDAICLSWSEGGCLEMGTTREMRWRPYLKEVDCHIPLATIADKLVCEVKNDTVI